MKLPTMKGSFADFHAGYSASVLAKKDSEKSPKILILWVIYGGNKGRWIHVDVDSKAGDEFQETDAIAALETLTASLSKVAVIARQK